MDREPRTQYQEKAVLYDSLIFIFELIVLRIASSAASAFDSRSSPFVIAPVTKLLSESPDALILTFRNAPLMHDLRANAPTPASLRELGLPFSTISLINSNPG